MTSFTPTTSSTVNLFEPDTVPDQSLKCIICKDDLTMEDKQKTTAKFWKNCKRCRDKMRTTAILRRFRASRAATITHANTASHKKRRTDLHTHSSHKRSKPQRFPSMVGADRTWRGSNDSATFGANPVGNAVPSTKYTRPLWIHRAMGYGSNNMNVRKSGLKLPSWASPDVISRSVRKVVEQEKEEETEVEDQEQEPNRFSNHTAPAVPLERDCSVCADSFPAQDFPSLEGCEHEPDVCHDDFLQWINQRMANMETVTCPSSGCSVEATHADVQKYASKEDFARFDELSKRSFLSADKSFLYCLAEGCPSGQIHDTGVEGPIFRCAACGFRMCTAHDPIIPFHEEEVCTQYNERIEREAAEARAREEEEDRIRTQQEEEMRIRREQEEASAAEVAKSSVECPGCGSQIAKISGCDHMTCRRNGCGFQFCYLCRAPFLGRGGIVQVGNSAHAQSCRHHSARLPSYEDYDDDLVLLGMAPVTP